MLKNSTHYFAGSSIFLFSYEKFSDAYSSDFLLVKFRELFAEFCAFIWVIFLPVADFWNIVYVKT